MYKDGQAKICRLLIDGKEYELAFNADVISDWEKPIPAISNTRHITTGLPSKSKVPKGVFSRVLSSARCMV
jgi:hypothetical protein